MNDLSLPVDIAQFAPGLYPYLCAERYHAIDAMSASGAKKILRSPAHYAMSKAHPMEPTPAMIFGTLCHTAVLESHKLTEISACKPEGIDRRATQGKADWAAFEAKSAGKLIADTETFARVWAVADAVEGHPAARALLQDAQREVSVLWRSGEDAIPCKSRFDAVKPGLVIDLKTCQDASPGAFAKSVANFQYHLQAAAYCEAYESAYGAAPEAFVFIAVESEAPHGVAVYVLDDEALSSGRRLWAEALMRYRDCKASGLWPAYAETIETLTLPKWAL